MDLLPLICVAVVRIHVQILHKGCMNAVFNEKSLKVKSSKLDVPLRLTHLSDRESTWPKLSKLREFIC